MVEGLHIYRHKYSREFRVQNESRASCFKHEFSKAADRQHCQSSSLLPGPLTMGYNAWVWPELQVMAVQKNSFKILCMLSCVYKAVLPPVRLTEYTPIGYYMEKNFSF